MRKSYSFAFISFVCLMVLSMACSFPLLVPVEEVVVELPTTAPTTEVTTEKDSTSDDQPADTAADDAPLISSEEWDGTWTIWYSGISYPIDLLVQGKKISGSTVIGGGNSLSLIGTISDDNETIEGIWEITDGTSGDFMITILSSLIRFIGNFDKTSAFCGAREGAIKPDPCLE